MNLKVKIGTLELKNPLILASAGYTSSAAGLRKQIPKGYGAVVTKTVTPGPLKGAPNPKVFWYDPQEKRHLSGAEALKNPGADAMMEAVRSVAELAEREDCKIIGSCTANTLEEIAEICRRYEEAGAAAVELNMICPSTGPHLGPEYAQLAKWWARKAGRSVRLLSTVQKEIHIPLIAKIHMDQMLDRSYLSALDNACPPAAYSFVGGRMPNLKIDIKTGKPVLPGNLLLRIEKKMPISPMCTGPIKPSTILHTAYFSKLTRTPLICSGGLSKGTDILEAVMAGAQAVQICTAVYRDQDIARKMLSELVETMEQNGYDDINSLRGIALASLPEPPLFTVPRAKGF